MRIDLRSLALVSAATLLTAACSSTPPPAAAPTVATAPAAPERLIEARRIIGTENGVRVDAAVYGELLKESSNVNVNYDVINDRSDPVAIADIVPVSNYDPETRTITLEVGSEVPGEQFLPRLLVIPPGGKKSFSAAAHVGVMRPTDATFMLTPNALRVKVNFLGDVKPFGKLIGISERAVHDPQLASELFPKWIDRTEIVMTNALPMRWGGNSKEGQPGADWAPPHMNTGRRH